MLLLTDAPVIISDTRNYQQKHTRLAREQTMGFFPVVAKCLYT